MDTAARMYDAYPIALQPRTQRFEFFQDVVDRVFCPMHIQPGALCGQAFAGTVDVADLNRVRLAHVATSACTVKRRAEDIARLAIPGYLVKFQLAGRAVWTQRGREVHLRPGDFVICSTAEPYSLRFLEDYSMPVLALSEERMRDLAPDPDQFLGVRMRGEDPDCGLLCNFVAQVVARMSQLRDPMLARAEVTILDLLGTILAARAQPKLMSTTQQLQRIKVFVQKHLRDNRLSPAMIAAAFDISVRYVHALFREEPMTIGRYIRTLRLDGCRRALENDHSDTASLTELALHWGFYDLSHMSRCFREEFDLTPREFRERARAAQVIACAALPRRR
jgi:AraC family transcriptional activator of tynA and feaB